MHPRISVVSNGRLVRECEEEVEVDAHICDASMQLMGYKMMKRRAHLVVWRRSDVLHRNNRDGVRVEEGRVRGGMRGLRICDDREQGRRRE